MAIVMSTVRSHKIDRKEMTHEMQMICTGQTDMLLEMKVTVIGKMNRKEEVYEM